MILLLRRFAYREGGFQTSDLQFPLPVHLSNRYNTHRSKRYATYLHYWEAPCYLVFPVLTKPDCPYMHETPYDADRVSGVSTQSYAMPRMDTLHFPGGGPMRTFICWISQLYAGPNPHSVISSDRVGSQDSTFWILSFSYNSSGCMDHIRIILPQ